MTHGFTCPQCSEPDIPVIQTMSLDGGIRRRRKCPKCAKLLHTCEIPADLIPVSAKFDFLFRKATPQ